MERWTEILSYVNLAGAIYAVGLGGVLWFARSGRRRANRIWAALVILMAFLMCHGVFMDADIYNKWPWVGLLMGTLPLLIGPLCFFSVRALTDPAVSWRRGDAMHAAPFLAGLGIYASGRPDAPIAHAIPLVAWHAVALLMMAQTIAYVARVRDMLRRHEEAVRSACSTIDTVTLAWLRRRMVIYAALATVGTVLTTIVGQFIPAAHGLVSQLLCLLFTVNTFLTGYRAILQPAVFFPEEASRATGRYERSTLTLTEAERLEARLLALMEADRPFLDPNLTLGGLARALDAQPAHLSRVINERLHSNFFQFINHYRVRAACERLTSPGVAGEKLMAVALESGFNSLATFNRVFKELTGRTPSAYRRHPDPAPEAPAASN